MRKSLKKCSSNPTSPNSNPTKINQQKRLTKKTSQSTVNSSKSLKITKSSPTTEKIQGIFLEMSNLGVKTVISVHFWVKKRDFRAFWGQKMRFHVIFGIKRPVLILLSLFLAVFGHFRPFSGHFCKTTLYILKNRPPPKTQKTKITIKPLQNPLNCLQYPFHLQIPSNYKFPRKKHKPTGKTV